MDEDYYDEEESSFRWPSRFCGDPLWVQRNFGLGNSSSSPFSSLLYPSMCFQHAVLAQLAPLLLLASLPVLWIQLAAAYREQKDTKRPNRLLPWDILASMRHALSIALLGLKLLLLLDSCYEWLWQGEDVPSVEFLYPLVHIATLIVLLFYTEQCRLAGLVSPGPIFLCWLFFVLTGVPEFLFWLRMGSSPESVQNVDFLRYSVSLVAWPLCCIQLLIHCFAGRIPLRDDESQSSSPEPRVSFLSRQLFFWFDTLVRRGHKRPLAEADVYELEPALRTHSLHRIWTREWTKQMQEYYGMNQSALQIDGNGAKQSSSRMRKRDSERIPLLDDSSKEYGAKGEREDGTAAAAHHRPPPSIIACLWRLFKWEVCGAMVVKFISDLLQFANPLLLGQLIAFVEDPSLPSWIGYLLAATLFGASELRSLLMNQYFILMNSVGCQVQSVLTSAVYAKTLRLSGSARRGRTSGEIANLMAIDVDRFQTITPLLQQLWSSPLQVVISLYLLQRTIGWAVVGGVFVMVALVPCNLVVVRFTKRWQMEQMSCKDKRLRMTNEVLTGIRAVKLYAWEVPMMAAIETIRRQEIRLLKKASLLRTTTEVLNIASPFLVAIISFSIYILSDPVNHLLTPEVAFVSLTLFSQLRVPMMILAELVAQMVQTAVSNRRLKEFMVAEEVDPLAVNRELEAEYERAVDIEFASFDWQQRSSHLPRSNIAHSLNNVELHIRRGLLVAVVGKVGAGKSSLLSAILGEMHKVHGYVGLRGSVAYVPQQPWILNQTVRENILFNVHEGEPVDEKLYTEVLDACALRSDLAVLPNGDGTEIGEKGINLSGGQKARVNLARALYRRADVYLLDDPLSAVDAIVGRHLFDRAIGPESMAKGSTRILVTHSLAYLSHCDWIVVMEQGHVKRQGTYAELLRDEGTAQMIARMEEDDNAQSAAFDGNSDEGNLDGDEDEDREEKAEESGTETVRTRSSASTTARQRRRTATMSRRSRASSSRQMPKKVSKVATEGGRLVRDETAETGRVSARVYRDYFAAMRWPLFAGFCVFMVVHTATSMAQSFWLSSWSDDNSATSAVSGQPKMSLAIRLGVYAFQGCLIVIFLGLSNVFQIMGSVSASIRLHGPLLQRIMHAPVSFFDTTPLGRVLNRFGKEFDTVDLRLAGAFRYLTISLLMVLQVMLIVAISTPLFVLVDIPISLLYVLILIFFIPTSRQLQRLSSVSRSPLYNLFGETIAGTVSIRAYGVAAGFFDAFSIKLDRQIGFRYFSLIASRWLSIRLELIGNIVILSSAVLAVLSKQWGTVTAGLIGLSVSRSLDITFMLGFLVRNINDVELSVVSVERILEYMRCPQEADWQSPRGQGPSADWPGKGAIHFEQFSCRYRLELDLSLRNINAEIRPREKVGVVGRTGAGKTSLALALFRIVEAAGGRILIDGVDIARLGLQELRSRITIIPQDPVLFSGTLRFNLDPFNVYTDAELWMALEHVHLKEFVREQHEGLSHQIAESGDNISVGQRQLLCLARAILRRSAVIVLDEATASIDAQTDTLIQKTIRSEFQHSTILTIAHRISTVLDYDRIMVLSSGSLVEFDTPTNLMANKHSQFFELVNSNSEQPSIS